MLARHKEITKRVMAAEANVPIDLSDISSIKHVTFDTNPSDNEFSWIAGRTDSPLYMQPLRSTWMVKTFKTLNGAKRNFLRRMFK